MKNTTRGLMLLTAVASLAASAGDKPAPGKTAKEAAKISCAGVNECKGKGSCGGVGHDCGGQNECKGKGWISLSAEDCKKKGGTILADKK